MEENPQGLEIFIARPRRERLLARWVRLERLKRRLAGQCVTLNTRLGEPSENVHFLFQNYDSVLNLEQTSDIIDAAGCGDCGDAHRLDEHYAVALRC